MSKNRQDRMRSRMAEANELSDQASKVEQDRVNTREVPEGTDSAASVAQDSPIGVSVQTAAPEQTAQVKTVADVYAGKSDTVRSIIIHLETYTQEMAPGRYMTPDQILSNQKMLFRNLQQLVNLPDAGEFAICFSRLLKLVNENRNKAFAINMVMRNMSAMPQGDNQLNNYRFFLDTVIAFSDPAHRRLNIKKWNLQQASLFALPAFRDRLAGFIREICGE
ncbi:hypothetical protein CPT_Moabite_100 [Serratia phage Moabite]|uniref:Uncharacterized protein n=3 Tax=Moabitevirus TaxID=2843422 RepID=A0A7T3TLV9_9CAUD|nr:hypothetical protein HWB23_gp007 [Serratia phage vB_SmaM_ 2050HW]YP_009849194.1 hypothetical protein HWC48_gp316 [Serratia phage Moabite]QPX76723.1 hypothetical protein [Serratia phage vB_SmaM_Yaphecito]UCR74632.1 hypothetical protein [Serratia phage BUCT660]UGO53986.1 hypothetical protein HAYMO_4 [Serratia phage vB_SmaM_Haymo]UQT03494.1 hypothetical protein KODAMA_00270 [Serratia phage vB_SmaM-Kodama]URG14199.1 hypothetical protein [Pectobacterium phage vB_ParM-25]